MIKVMKAQTTHIKMNILVHTTKFGLSTTTNILFENIRMYQSVNGLNESIYDPRITHYLTVPQIWTLKRQQSIKFIIISRHIYVKDMKILMNHPNLKETHKDFVYSKYTKIF